MTMYNQGEMWFLVSIFLTGKMAIFTSRQRENFFFSRKALALVYSLNFMYCTLYDRSQCLHLNTNRLNTALVYK